MKKISLDNLENGKRFIAISKVCPEGKKFTYYGVDTKVEEPYNIKIIEEVTNEISYVEPEWFNQRIIYNVDEMPYEVSKNLLIQWNSINRHKNIRQNNIFLKDNEYVIFKHYSPSDFIISDDGEMDEMEMMNTNGIQFKVAYNYDNDTYDILAQKYNECDIIFSKLYSDMYVDDLDVHRLIELVEYDIRQDFEKVWKALNNEEEFDNYDIEFMSKDSNYEIHYTDKKSSGKDKFIIELISLDEEKKYKYNVILAKIVDEKLFYIREFSGLRVEELDLSVLLKVAENSIIGECN